ncbi:hypothetical protein ABZ864_41445 [Streptomyces sp. NPDC047082]|uniref:hypothetical protein n=1 Tax=Streptomyces sp. NPDC047082 TaxID=3155259 RepID=UPI003400B1DF
MSNPQSPSARRSGKGGATPQQSRSLKATEPGPKAPKKDRPHGQDRGSKGGGEGGGTPPEQQPEHP